MAKQGEARGFRNVDDPSVRETFVDHIQYLSFHEGAARFGLAVTRLDASRPGGQPSGDRRLVARLAMTPRALVDLYQSLSKMIESLEAEGVITRTAKPVGPIQ